MQQLTLASVVIQQLRGNKMATLTAANCSLFLSITGLFPVPQQIQGFATDDAFAADEVEFAQTVMGVDGVMSGGYTPVMTPLNITLQPDSPSMSFFETIISAQKTARDVFRIDGFASLPSMAWRSLWTALTICRGP